MSSSMDRFNTRDTDNDWDDEPDLFNDSYDEWHDMQLDDDSSKEVEKC